MTKQLTVYKASAGSGKTFTLAVEYISLLIENPLAYKNILAVTFTNKATEEMKERILSQLYGIWKGLSESDDYLEKIREKIDYSEEMIRERAGIALHLLIHHYHYFRIETIDSFFQSVLRNLAKELNLTANLHISLDDQQIERQAVDEIIESFSPNDPMLIWLIQYIEETIDNDKSWNVIYSLKEMGMNIFKDFYKKNSKALGEAMQGDSFKMYVNMLRQIREDAKKTMSNYGDRFYEAMEKHGLCESDFSGSTKIYNYFKKLKEGKIDDKSCVNKSLDKCINDPENWVTKTNRNRTQILSVITSVLHPLLLEAEQARKRLLKEYISATLILDNINQVRLLHQIEDKVHELNQETNRFLLSDTQQLLQNLMKDTDTPFVFEKIGSQLSHVMIDEFQDTSKVQWENFLLLLKETMSHAITDEQRELVNNLIVGDVKQSIYRWRNSDWRLLNGITDQFADSKRVLDIKPLDKNYRSYTNIVHFNNIFFTHAVEKEASDIITKYNNPDGAESIRSAYKNVCQQKKNPEKKDGYVNVQLFTSKDFTEQSMCEMVGQHVDRLLAMGIPQKDIAILVRNKKTDVPRIANYFMQTRPVVNIISEEAFELQSSMTVSTLMDSLRLLLYPDVTIYKENIKSTIAHIHATVDVDDIFADPQRFQHLSLIDLLETLFTQLQLSLIPHEGAYLYKFFDEVMSFSRDNGSDISLFLDEWDNTMKKKTIQTNVADGIQLISIHKSKGLEFPYLIIPFCDWLLEHSAPIWFEPPIAPFNAMPIVPVKYSSQLAESIFNDDYQHEHLQNVVDNLNLLYVAFTRAKKGLVVIGRKRDSRYRSELIETVLDDLSKDIPDALYQNDDNSILFEYGTIPNTEKKEDKSEQSVKNVFTSLPVDEPLEYYPSHHQVVFQQSNKSKEFLADDEPSQQKAYIKIGNVLHYLFSKIRTKDDVPMVLKALEQEGILYDDDISLEHLQDMLDKRLHDPRVASWFSPHWTLYNECSILTVDKEGHVIDKRPDRVMVDGNKAVVVDFKFGKFIDDYKSQVKRYMELLKQMGYSQVEGYLWMVYTNIIVPVK